RSTMPSECNSHRPSPSQQASFLKKTGVSLKDFALKHKLFEKGTEQVEQKINPLQKSFDEIVEQSGRKVEIKNLFDKVKSRILELEGANAPELQRKGNAIRQYFSNLFEKQMQKGETSIDVGKLTKERRIIDDLVKKFKNDPNILEPNQEIRNILQTSIKDATKGAKGVQGKSLDELGKELHKFYSFKDIAEKQQFIGQGSLPFGITNLLFSILGGGAGGGVAGLPGAFAGAGAGYAASKALSSPKVISALSKGAIGAGGRLAGAGEQIAGQKLYPQLAGLLGVGALGAPQQAQAQDRDIQEDQPRFNRGQGLSEQAGLPTQPQDQFKTIFSLLMLNALKQTGGKNIDKYGKLYKFLSPESNLTNDERNKISAAKEGLGIVDVIQNNYSELQQLGQTAKTGGLGRLGGIFGSLGAISQLGQGGEAAASYKRTVEGFLSRLSRATGEKGVLTDQDVARIRKAIPTFYDTPEVAARNFNTIKDIIGSALQSKTGSQNQNPLFQLLPMLAQ
ncbi:MAG: hypothetical protein AABY22_03500, partial [Nanoarchaeota archaeon]